MHRFFRHVHRKHWGSHHPIFDDNWDCCWRFPPSCHCLLFMSISSLFCFEIVTFGACEQMLAVVFVIWNRKRSSPMSAKHARRVLRKQQVLQQQEEEQKKHMGQGESQPLLSTSIRVQGRSSGVSGKYLAMSLPSATPPRFSDPNWRPLRRKHRGIHHSSHNATRLSASVQENDGNIDLLGDRRKALSSSQKNEGFLPAVSSFTGYNDFCDDDDDDDNSTDSSTRTVVYVGSNRKKPIVVRFADGDDDDGFNNPDSLTKQTRTP